MRLPRVMALGIGAATLGLAYYVNALDPSEIRLTISFGVLGSLMVLLSATPLRTRRWRIFARAFVVHGVATMAAAITAAILGVPAGLVILMVLLGALSAGAFIVTLQCGRRYRLIGLNANYFR